MSWLMASIYDRFMAATEKACLHGWRRDLLQNVSGNVLEIGAGTGANIEHYPAAVTHLDLSEPDDNMRARLCQKLEQHTRNNTVVHRFTAEAIEAPDDSFDYVVSTLVCCSVQRPDAALVEIHRVLKPGGRLIFLEHVAAPETTRRRRWQDRLTPLWRKIAGNCHLNRDTESSISRAGFEIISIQRESMRKALPIVRPSIRGMARKRRAQ